MGEVVAPVALVASAIGGIVSGRKQRKESKAARQAAQAANQASKASVVTQTNTVADPTTTTAQTSEDALQKRAKKRMSMTDTINTFTPAGLRNKLG